MDAVFDTGGKFIFPFSPRPDAGPVKNSFDQSFTDMPLTLSAYLVTLQKTTPDPLLKESDEETGGETDKAKEEAEKEDS